MTKEQYQLFAQEITADLEDKVLKLTDKVQILREDQEIIDWYHDHETMMSTFEFNNTIKSEEEMQETLEEKEMYLEDKPNLTEVTVLEFLTEIAPNSKYLAQPKSSKKPKKKKR